MGRPWFTCVMNVAILSAGPCLIQTFDPDTRHDLRIGVNRAAGVIPCDWWSCGDGQTFREHVPIGLPVLFTMDHQDGQLRADNRVKERVARHRVVVWGDCNRALDGLPACWSNWSITASLALAVWQGAKRVDVHGHYYDGEDETNCTDVSGKRLDKRKETRPRVIADWRQMVSWANKQGITVEEHRP